MNEPQIELADMVDPREVVTKSQMEGRPGEKWTLYHMQRNT